MTVDNRSDEQLAAMGERLTRARVYPSGALKAQRYGDLQTVATVDCGQDPMPAEVVAQLKEMEESIQRRVERAMAERRVKDLDHQIEFLKKQVNVFDRALFGFYATVGGGLLLLLAMWLWQEVAK